MDRIEKEIVIQFSFLETLFPALNLSKSLISTTESQVVSFKNKRRKEVCYKKRDQKDENLWRSSPSGVGTGVAKDYPNLMEEVAAILLC